MISFLVEFLNINSDVLLESGLPAKYFNKSNREFNEVIFEAHRKKLPANFVFNMLQNYGPRFHCLFKPVYTRLPEQLTRLSLTFYVGQMLFLAHKP